MPTFVHLPSGNWRAVIRRKGRHVAEAWALDMGRVELGPDVSANPPASLHTVAALIDLHISDMHEVRKELAPVEGRLPPAAAPSARRDRSPSSPARC